ncbi:MAG: 4-hydroxy-3-methylbut-2-enyl diphosphate reductase [bacterium]
MPPPEQQLRLLIASPRGFCAGVERAIEVVERVLVATGVPLYVRKEIVHNRAVVADFRERGVVFVEELHQVPDCGTVIFSAHGVAPDVWREAEARNLRVIDATCPLVTKVHREVIRHAGAGRAIILIGHPGHDEVLGTMGEAPQAIRLVTDLVDIEHLELEPSQEVAYVTQTTLSVDETTDIVANIRARYPHLIDPARSDICFATQNRQDAVKELVARRIQLLLVVGSHNSSNSQRLCEVAERMGVPALLIDGPDDLPLTELEQYQKLGLTAGASAPEPSVQAVTRRLQVTGWNPEEVVVLDEDVRFMLPSELETLDRE